MATAWPGNLASISLCTGNHNFRSASAPDP